VRQPAVVAALAALVVVALSAWGLGARDLAGDEINMLHGSPGQILEWSLDPRGGFVGHLPWSFWLRWASLSVFGEAPAWAWRLHSVVGGALAAGLTGWAAVRCLGWGAGLLAAAIVALDPVLAFHTQDASNYAWSAAVGAGILAGLLELRDHRKGGAYILGATLLVGALNDFYSVLIAGPALAASVWLARPDTLRRPILAAWLAPLAVVLPVVVLFAVRLLSATGEAVVDVHADPIPPRPLPAMLDAPWRVANRVLGAHLHGYSGGRDDSVWIGGPPVLLALSCVLLNWRSRAWPAAALVGGGLLLHGLLGIGLQLGAERVLPYEPRSLIGLTPALAVLLAGLTQGTRPGIGAAIALTWLAGAGLSTLQARLLPADLRVRAVATASELLQSADTLVVPDGRTVMRLSADLRSRAQPCLPDNAVRAVWIANHAAEEPPACGASSSLVVHTRTHFDAPVHEGSAASFLPRRVVSTLGPPPAPQLSRQPSLAPTRLFDGLEGARWELSTADGRILARADHLPGIQTDLAGSVVSWLNAFPGTRSAMPDHPLFAAHHNRLASWEVDPRSPSPVFATTPLSAPALTSLRRLLPIFGLLLCAVAALPRRTA